MNEEELNHFLNELELIGKFNIIEFNADTPIVFLIDEKHHDNQVIRNNIHNVTQLIDHLNISLMGVESHAGGLRWDQYDEVYLEDTFYNNESVNTCPDFANAFKDKQVFVHGVECRGILDKIQCHLSVQDNPFFGQPIQNHPLNTERSRHFIKTLFWLVEQNNLRGNFILNCGSNHNNHIQNWIENEEILNFIGVPATYVRISTIKQ